MPTILAYTSPARGHLFPLVPIVDELVRRGHHVVLRTVASDVQLMGDRGLDVTPIDPAIERIEQDDFRGRSTMDGLKRAVTVFTRRAPLDMADLQTAIGEVQPDALLVDVNAWGAIAAAEASGLPWTVYSPYVLPVTSRDAPPFGPGLAPARGVPGRLRDRLLRPLIVGSVERIFLGPLNELRDRVDLDPVGSLRDNLSRPDILLCLTAEPFEYPRTDWMPNVRLVGPMGWDPPAPPPAWLEQIQQPVLLVTTSTESQDDGRLVETALAAFADEDVFVVATVPSGSAAAFDPPANSRVESFVPHGAVLDKAVCAITHGGMGATQKALARGVPVCAVPFGRDQMEVARRVEQSGAGTRLPASKLNPPRLRAAVHQARQRTPGARRLAEAFRQAGGAPAAADHIESTMKVDRRPA